MKSIILSLITAATLSLSNVLKLFGFGGTALPGLWVEKYAPWLISIYAKQYGKIILITGTNGKTTTQLALVKVLEAAGLRVVANTSGSNMLRGVATTLMTGGVVQKDQSALLCEVEEATMPRLTKLFHVDIVVITNMYRDQLDAYGELDKTAGYIKSACQNSPNAVLVFNGDDPVIASFAEGLSHKKIIYSLGEFAKEFQYENVNEDNHSTTSSTQPDTESHRNDSQNTTRTGQAGAADLLIKSITLNNDLSTENEFSYQGVDLKVAFKPPGKYNVYTLLASYATAQVLGLSNEHIMKGIASVHAPFGRGEAITFKHNNKSVTFQIFLVKNPAGYSQVWEMLKSVPTPFNLILGLNDQIADGRDVSWIWDIEFGSMHRPDTLQLVSFTGRRGYDMALRMKYAGIAGTGQNIIIDIQQCLDNMVQKTTDGRQCFVLMTYTAMNEFRSALSKYVTIVPYSV